MATSSPSSPISPLAEFPRSRVLSFFGKLVPGGSILPSSPTSPSTSSLSKLRRRRSNESFPSGDPPLFLLCSNNEPFPTPSDEPTFQMDFNRPQPMSPTIFGTPSSLVSASSRPGFGASSASIFEAQKANPPSGLYFTPLKAVDGRIRGLKDFGPVVDAGPRRVAKKVRRGSGGKGDQQQRPSPLKSSHSQTHYSHRPYTPPDLIQTTSPLSSLPFSSLLSLLTTPLPTERTFPLNLDRPLPNLFDESLLIWTPGEDSPGSTEEGREECITPSQGTMGERQKKREGSAVWDPMELNGYFQIQRERIV